MTSSRLVGHRAIRAPARLVPAPTGGDATAVRVEFAEPVRAVTPGQAAVFYAGDVLLGGGWIAAAEG